MYVLYLFFVLLVFICLLLFNTCEWIWNTHLLSLGLVYSFGLCGWGCAAIQLWSALLFTVLCGLEWIFVATPFHVGISQLFFFFHHTGCRLSACLTGTTGWGWSHSPLLSQTLFPAQPTSMVWHPRSCLGGWHAGIGLPVCWPSHVMWKSTPHTWLGCTFNAWCAARLVGNTSTNFPPDFLYDCPFGGMYFLNFICTVLWAFCQQAYLVFMLSVFLSLPDATSMTQLLR